MRVTLVILRLAGVAGEIVVDMGDGQTFGHPRLLFRVSERMSPAPNRVLFVVPEHIIRHQAKRLVSLC